MAVILVIFHFYKFTFPMWNMDFLLLLLLLKWTWTIRTWNSGVEERVKPSEPGCLTKGRAPGVSWANVALKTMSPNAAAWVSGWALSWKVTERKLFYEQHKFFCCVEFAKVHWKLQLTNAVTFFLQKCASSAEMSIPPLGRSDTSIHPPYCMWL